MRLNTGQQAALDHALRDLRLVQHALTNASVEPGTVLGLKRTCSEESDAIRTALNTIDAIIRTTSEEN